MTEAEQIEVCNEATYKLFAELADNPEIDDALALQVMTTRCLAAVFKLAAPESAMRIVGTCLREAGNDLTKESS
jgi:hypothetical protein